MSQTPDLFGANTGNQFDQPKQIDYTKIFCCPQCGSTDLISKALVSVVQTPEGEWTVQVDNESGDLDYAMRNINNSVACTNPNCGPMIDDMGRVMPFHDETGAFAYFKDNNNLPGDFTKEQLHDDERLSAEFDAFIETLHCEPWAGTIGECNTL